MDAPATPGDWSYQSGWARFTTPEGQVLLNLGCNGPTGVVWISRPGQVPSPPAMTVRAETMQRSVAVQGPAPAEATDRRVAVQQPTALAPMVVASLPATDPLLDALAFSKGHFAVEVSGLATLYLPSYPEVTRAIEECR
jgi:hypothetical protein